MALPSLVEIEALEGLLGLTFDASNQSRAAAVLSAVSALVRSEAGQTWTDESDLLEDVPDVVSTVVLMVAQRVWNNPQGVVQEALGNWSVRYADPQASGLYLTPGEKSLLGRYRANQRGLWSLSTTRDDPDSDTAYVPVLGGPPFPWYGSDVEVS